ncbi:MAG: phosphate ABC transporter permease PstA [Candidatus Lokiarchaeota archaeon]|nr:phosphate ABC transporter permease PstA [Candidatus Lokiarchaeota archaeon]
MYKMNKNDMEGNEENKDNSYMEMDDFNQKDMSKPKTYEALSVKIILTIVSIIAASFVFFIIIFLFLDGLPIFQYADVNVFGFLWNPEGSPDTYGVMALVIGTLLVTLGAIIIAVPIGLGAAIFIAEIAPSWLKSTLKGMTEILAGIPSIVYGFFGYTVLLPAITQYWNAPHAGYSWFAGSFILSIMILPTIVSISEDSLNSVPMLYKEASLGVGATKWQTISKISLPSASSGILSGIVLGVGRAIGETMAVLLITGNAVEIPMPITNIFDQIGTITGIIASQLPTQSAGAHFHALFFLGCILFILIMIINIVALVIIRRINRKFHPEVQKQREKASEESSDSVDKEYENAFFGRDRKIKDEPESLIHEDDDDKNHKNDDSIEDTDIWQDNESGPPNKSIKSKINEKTKSFISDLTIGKVIKYIFYGIFYYFIINIFYNFWGLIWTLIIGLAILGIFIGSIIVNIFYGMNLKVSQNLFWAEVLGLLIWIIAGVSNTFLYNLSDGAIGFWANNGMYIAMIVGVAIVVFYLIYRQLSVKIHKWSGYITVGLAMLFVFTALSILLFFIIGKGVTPFLNGQINFLEFITEEPSATGIGGGIFPAMIGTLMLVFGAIIIAAPLGIMTGIYLTEYAGEGKVVTIINNAIDNLNATPSIVFGMFGVALFINYLGWDRSLIVGQIALGLMILPVIIKTTEEAIKAIPQSFREGSMAMGATKWQTTVNVVLPPALPGILTGVILGVGRAAGETAPVMLTVAVFSTRGIPINPFEPAPALTYHLYYLLGECPTGNIELKFAYASSTAFVLLVLVLIIYAFAMVIRSYYRKQKKW